MRLIDHVLEYGIYLGRSLTSLTRFEKISAIAPTCDRVLEKVSALFPKDTDRWIEVGAGGGGLVRKILDEKISPGGTVLAIEPDAWFEWFMRHSIQDERVTIAKAFASELPPLAEKTFGRGEKARIISTSVPVSMMTPQQQDEFFGTQYDLLEPDGNQIVYIVRDIADVLLRYYPYVTMEKVWGQVIPPMPYRVHHAFKRHPAFRIFDPLLLEGEPSRNGSNGKPPTYPRPRVFTAEGHRSRGIDVPSPV